MGQGSRWARARFFASCFVMCVAVSAPVERAAAAQGQELPSENFGPWGFDLSGMDRSVRPGNDFYRYANGSWADRVRIPADRVSYQMFTVVRAAMKSKLQAVVVGGAQSPVGTDARKASDFYQSFLDKRAIERAGLRPIGRDLSRIAKLKSKVELAEYLGGTHHGFGTSFFRFVVTSDSKRSQTNAVYAAVNGVGLDSGADEETIAAYRGYITRQLQAARAPHAAIEAQRVLDFERELAKAWQDEAASGDNYQAFTVAELRHVAPGFAWEAFFQAAGVPFRAKLVLETDAPVLPRIARLLRTTPIATLKAWATFHLVDESAPYLSADISASHFAFHETLMKGRKVPAPDEDRALDETSAELPDLVGKLYVSRYFPPAAKIEVVEMVKNVKTAMKRRIERLAWMSP